jgi:hypothetical protein
VGRRKLSVQLGRVRIRRRTASSTPTTRHSPRRSRSRSRCRRRDFKIDPARAQLELARATARSPDTSSWKKA